MAARRKLVIQIKMRGAAVLLIFVGRTMPGADRVLAFLGHILVLVLAGGLVLDVCELASVHCILVVASFMLLKLSTAVLEAADSPLSLVPFFIPSVAGHGGG